MTNPWFQSFRRNAKSTIRIICFHYAGGSAGIFQAWPDQLPMDVELLAIQLPGHGNRYHEQLISSFDNLAEELWRQIRTKADLPTVFFGHSIGALLAYEIACMLEVRDGRRLRHLIASAHKAPHLPSNRETKDSGLADHEFLTRLRTYGGTPEDILQNSELMQVLLPIIRADFAVSESYEFRQRPKLSCAITAIGGKQDAWISSRDIEAWGDLTNGSFQYRLFDGGHFFLESCRKELLWTLNRILRGEP